MSWRLKQTNTPRFSRLCQGPVFVILAILCLLFVGCSAASQTLPPDAEARRPARFSKGLLWRITAGPSPGQEAVHSYLFGTIHSEDPRVIQLPPVVQRAFDGSTSFCAELPFDQSTLAQLGQGMVYTDGRNLRSILGGDLFERVVPLMAEHGVPESALSHLKPWAIFLTLSMPKPQTGLFLDAILYKMAQQQGKSVCGLETAAEQIEIFDRIPLADQVALVRETVNQYHSLPQLFASLLERYLARDLAGLVMLTEANSPARPEEKRIYETFLHRLLNGRNTRMVDRLVPRLQTGSVFIAVGALHLPGDEGILHLLQNRGYQVSADY
ncbi:MAG: TraB/GumN family protein [Candidatus Binatia bacterium]